MNKAENAGNNKNIDINVDIDSSESGNVNSYIDNVNNGSNSSNICNTNDCKNPDDRYEPVSSAGSGDEHALTTKQKRILTIFILAMVVILSALFIIFVALPVINYLSDPEQFRVWVDSHGISGRILFVFMIFMQAIIAVVPGEPFEIAAGYAFGAVEGTILCLTGSSLGSMTAFYIGRKFGLPAVKLFFSEEKINSLKFLKQSDKRDMLILSLFILPGTPKDLISYIVGLTDIAPLTWAIICSVGRLPSILTSTIGGNALENQNYIQAVLVFLVTFLISAAGILIYRRICAKNNSPSKDNSSAKNKFS